MCEDRENEYVKRTTFFNTRIKTKINAPPIRIQSITMEAGKNGDKDGKALYKVMNNAVYAKAVEKFRKNN